MCINKYIDQLCVICGRTPIQSYLSTDFCHLTNGVQMCASGVQEFHDGPTDRGICEPCDHRLERRRAFASSVRRQDVISSQMGSEMNETIRHWRARQEVGAELRAEYLDTGMAEAGHNGGLLLEQSFDGDFAEAFAPPAGLQYHHYYARYSRGFHSPSMAGAEAAHSEPWYPGYDTNTASRTTYQGGPPTPVGGGATATNTGFSFPDKRPAER